MLVGKEIKHHRKARGITQTELAKKVGISLDQISQIEREVSNPKQTTLVRICDALGIQQKLVVK